MMAAAEPEMMPDPQVQMMPDHQMLPMHQLAELQAMPALETPAPTNEAGWEQEEDQAAWTYEDDGPEPAQAAPYPSEGGYAAAPPTAPGIRRPAGGAVGSGGGRAGRVGDHRASGRRAPQRAGGLASAGPAAGRQPARGRRGVHRRPSPLGAHAHLHGRGSRYRPPHRRGAAGGLPHREARGLVFKSLRLAVSVRLAPSGAPAAETAAPPGTRAGRTPDPAPRNPGF